MKENEDKEKAEYENEINGIGPAWPPKGPPPKAQSVILTPNVASEKARDKLFFEI